MDTQYLIGMFELEGSLLDKTLRGHPLLCPLFSRNFVGVDVCGLKRAYLQLLKLKTDYVQYTVPALRAAGRVLRDGDDGDRRWSKLLFGYAAGETSDDDDGHEVWARNDMAALGASAGLLDAPPHASTVFYRKYFVEDAAHHPYAILGAKGVLERFAIRISDDVVDGIVASGIANAEQATSFFGRHGVLDIDHVREGERNLERLEHPDKRFQVLAGVHVTSGTYRALVHHLIAA